MTIGFRRTNKTNLTDNELMLFDAIFDLWISESALKASKFSRFHNFPYEHTLSNEELSETLDKLKKRKLIKSRKGLYIRKSKAIKEKRDYYTLTSEGGRLWSLERNPDWNRYCTHWIGLETKASAVEVCSPSQQTIENYTETEFNNLNEKLGVSIEANYKILENSFLLPWKRFSKVHVAEWNEPFSLIREFEWNEIEYTKKRVNSWSNVNDLLDGLELQN